MPASIREISNLIEGRLGGQWFEFYTGTVPSDPQTGYTTYYPSAGHTFSEDLGASANRLRWTGRFVCSGYGKEQTLDVVDSVRALLTRWAPFPDDLSTGRLIEIDEDAPLLPDATVPGDLRLSLTLAYRLHTNRS